MGTSSMNGPFSIAMLNYQRLVFPTLERWNMLFSDTEVSMHKTYNEKHQWVPGKEMGKYPEAVPTLISCYLAKFRQLFCYPPMLPFFLPGLNPVEVEYWSQYHRPNLSWLMQTEPSQDLWDGNILGQQSFKVVRASYKFVFLANLSVDTCDLTLVNLQINHLG